MNTRIAAAFMEANQNWNSPYERADRRFTAFMMPMSASPSSHGGKPSQPCRMLAPAIASTGTTIIQKYQYSQPATNPAHGPKPAHHQQHQRAGDQVAQHDGRPGRSDGGAAADEQPRADHPPDRDHGDVAWLQSTAELRQAVSLQLLIK